MTASRAISGSASSEAVVPWRHADWTLLAVTAFLLGSGIVALWSERVAKGADPAILLNRQGIAFALGGLGMIAVMAVDYRSLRQYAPLFYGATCFLLLAVRFIGQEVNGIKAWFDFGPLQLQPSELCKVTLVLMLAAFAAEDRAEQLEYDRFVRCLLLAFLPIGLVMLQPDLGTASTLVAITMGVLLIARAPVRHIALITALSIASVVGIVSSGFLDQYQVERITSFIDQEGNAAKDSSLSPFEKARKEDLRRQVKMSKQSVTLGRVTGAGFGKGLTTKGKLVPNQENDFIFSAIAEQFGLLGSGFILLLYLIVLLRCIRIAQLAPDHMGALIAVGAATLIAWHVFENVGMNLGIMPVTGIPLPLVSYGGSASLAFLLVLGLVQSVHMRRYTRL